MTLRGWFLLLGTVWCLTCLSGCLNSSAQVSPDLVRNSDPPAPKAPTEEETVAANTVPSPYHDIAISPTAEVPAAAPVPTVDRQNLYKSAPTATDVKPEEPPAPPPEDPTIIKMIRCLLDKRPEAPGEAVALVQKYPAANQDLLLQLLPLVTRLTEGSIDQASPQEMTHIVEMLDGITTQLRGQAPLGIDRICYCKRITRFGEYEAYGEQKAFRPGELVQLYVELRNVVSEPTGPGFEIRLASTVEIRDDQGRVVWRLDCPDRNHPDRSPTQRHDCFASHMFYLPENFAPGQYTLHVSITDLHTRRRSPAQASLAMEVTHRP
jgi:hypothetical protein